MRVDKKYKKLHLICSDDESREVLFHIHHIKTDALGDRAVATDGRRLVCVPVEDVKSFEEGALIFKDFWKRALSMKTKFRSLYSQMAFFKVKKRTFDAYDLDEKNIGKDTAPAEVWRQDSHRFDKDKTGKEHQVRFPDTSQVMPQADDSFTSFTFNPKYLLEIAQAMGIENDIYGGVTLSFKDELSPAIVTLNTSDPKERKPFGIIMPIRDSESLKNYPLYKKIVYKENERPPKAGDRIRFKRTLECGPNDDGPGNHYATKGQMGTVDKVGGCIEGYWVFWDGWKSASFGCAWKDFEIVQETDLDKTSGN